jgi:hypothetical protein
MSHLMQTQSSIRIYMILIWTKDKSRLNTLVD